MPPSDRWPARLTELLREGGRAVEDPIIIARTGWTTDELSAGIDAAHITGWFDLVTLLIGVNDQYRGRSVVEYGEGFVGLLHRAIDFADAEASRVVVVAIPDWGVTPFAAGRDRARVAAEIDAYNALNRREAMAVGARYADIVDITRRAAEEPVLIAEDGLHPSGAMYREWAQRVLPIALSVL